jgi:predicted esterase
MKEHHIAVRRTARYYTLGEPGGRELWFVLHGYSQLARRFLRRFESLAAPDRCIVAPEALNRYYSEYSPGHHAPDARIGATWMTKEDRVADIDDYVTYLDVLYDDVLSRYEVRPARIVVLGFSQGAATAARWAALGNARFHELLCWGGWLPHDLELRAGVFHDARLRLVYGVHDGYTPVERVESHRASLVDAGLAHDVVWFDGGHEVTATGLQQLA